MNEIITATRGEDVRFTININDENDNPVNLTGYGFLCSIRTRSLSTTAYTFNVTRVNVNLNPTSNILEYYLSSNITKLMTPQIYYCDTKMTLPDLTIVYPKQLKFRLRIEEAMKAII